MLYMTYRSTPEIVRAFCFNKKLTDSILDELQIIGNLQGRKICHILPRFPRLSHLTHRIRYFFNLAHYRDDFNDAARDYLKKASIRIERKPVVPPSLQPIVNPPAEPLPIDSALPAPAIEPVLDVAPIQDINEVIDTPPPVDVLPPVVEPKPLTLSSTSEEYLRLIHLKLGAQASELWRILLNHCLQAHGKDHLISLKLHGKSHTLTFREPLAIHFNPLKENNQPMIEGGFILTFGKNGSVEMEIEKGVIYFKNGVTCQVKKADGLQEVNICQFVCKPDGVIIKAKILGLPVGKKESYAFIKDTWSNRAKVISHEADFKKVLVVS